MHCIGSDIHQELVDLRRVPQQRGSPGFQARPQRDSRWQLRLQEVERLAHDLLHVHWHPFTSSPAERLDPIYQCASALRGDDDVADVALQPAVLLRTAQRALAEPKDCT